MEFGREAVAEHLVKNNMPTSAKLKNAFKEFVDDDWIAKDLEKCHERIMELRDKTLLDEFARKMHLLLSENGVKVVGNIVDDMSFDEENNIYFGKSELVIEHLDFSEHDKRFEDRIKLLKERIEKMEGEKKFLRMRCMEDAIDAFDRGSYGALTIVGRRGALEAENKLLKQRIAKLEHEKTDLKHGLNEMEKIKSHWIDRAVEWQQQCEKLEGEKSENCEEKLISDDVRPSAEWYENRYQQDCIEINRLNTTIDVLIHKIEHLRQFAGLE